MVNASQQGMFPGVKDLLITPTAIPGASEPKWLINCLRIHYVLQEFRIPHETTPSVSVLGFG